MEVTTQNSYFKFWILHGVGVGNGLNNNFLHFPPIFFAILDDFSKWIIVPKVIKNTIPIEKSSNMAKIWGEVKKPMWVTYVGLPM